MEKLINLQGLSEFLKKCKETFVTKKDNYIIIDWEGKDANDAAKKAEVDAQLKNIYLSNPLALLSVIFKDYTIKGLYTFASNGFYSDGETVHFYLADDETLADGEYQFSIV